MDKEQTLLGRRPPPRASGARRRIAASISDDLRSLVLILTQLFEQEVHDTEVLVHILNAKLAAERGLILSSRLAEMVDAAAGPGSTH
jgi:hypothetical protein